MIENKRTLSDTIVAISTPPGLGAIGVIRLSGSKAIDLVAAHFSNKKIQDALGHTALFGVIRNAKNEILDEVVCTVFKSPHSYTGEDIAEISCHGSPYILSSVMKLLLEEGARMSEPGEFTMRAFLNGKLDLSQAEAVADLIASESRITHSIAMKQVRGGFSNEIQELRQHLIDFAALIELELDFGEEDVEFADREKLKRLVQDIRKRIKQLSDSFQLGNVLKRGVSTVIAGRPNAGKSTLLNALLNEERAIVSEIAGTTRDTISEQMQIQGITFRFVDTAGIRNAQDTIEAIGVQRALEEIRRGTIVLYLLDVMTTTPEEMKEQLNEVNPDKVPCIILLNKMDLNPYTNPADYYIEGITGPENVLPLSAKNKMNIEALKEMLFKTIVSDPTLLEQNVVTNVRHLDALQRADQSLAAVLDGLATGISGDLVALDIRQALYHLGSITGSISTEDLLDSIFTRFCIGK
jgi:tRNA modification GTPase